MTGSGGASTDRPVKVDRRQKASGTMLHDDDTDYKLAPSDVIEVIVEDAHGVVDQLHDQFFRSGSTQVFGAHYSRRDDDRRGH